MALAAKSSIRSGVACRSRPAARQPRLVAARVANVTVSNFEEEVLQAEQPVLVDFWAAWCGPCRLVAPLMDWAETEYKGQNLKVVKIEHDGNMPLVQQYKVYGLPALIMFKDGKVVEGSKREGAITKPMLADYIRKNLAAVTANA